MALMMLVAVNESCVFFARRTTLYPVSYTHIISQGRGIWLNTDRIDGHVIYNNDGDDWF